MSQNQADGSAGVGTTRIIPPNPRDNRVDFIDTTTWSRQQSLGLVDGDIVKALFDDQRQFRGYPGLLSPTS